MKVVEAFTTACYDGSNALCRRDTLVIGSCPPHMSKTIHTPCTVKCEGVSQGKGDEKSIVQAFIP